MSDANPYSGAYPYLRERAHVWREIARYVRLYLNSPIRPLAAQMYVVAGCA